MTTWVITFVYLIEAAEKLDMKFQVQGVLQCL